MKKVYIVIIAVVVVLVLVAGYLGFVPGLSYLLGASSPRDLGVRATPADFASASTKLGRTVTKLDSGVAVDKSAVYVGSHPIDIQLSSEEFTATRQQGIYEYSPFGKDFQAKFNSDGTVEMSGVWIRDHIASYGKAFKINDAEIQTLTDGLNKYQSDPAFYLKGTVTITNNVPDIKIQDAQLGKVPIPTTVVPNDAVNQLVQETIQHIPGLSIDSLSISNGKMHIKGTYPDKIELASTTP